LGAPKIVTELAWFAIVGQGLAAFVGEPDQVGGAFGAAA
jgi:hypothetical protein